MDHRVCTNTTIYKETDPQEIEILFSYLGTYRGGRPAGVPGLQLRRGQ